MEVLHEITLDIKNYAAQHCGRSDFPVTLHDPCNVVRATIQGLASLRNAEQVAATRGKTVQDILG